MQVKFSGNAEFGVAIGLIGNFIGDAEKISSCIPDSRDFDKKDDAHFSIVVEVGVGMATGELLMHCTIEKPDNNKYLYSMEGRGLGSNVKVRLALGISGKGSSSTQINWDTSVELTGIMGSVGEPAVRHFAEAYVDKIIANLGKEMGVNKNR